MNFSLFLTGVYGGWKAHALGKLNNVTTDSLLKSEVKEDMTVSFDRDSHFMFK